VSRTRRYSGRVKTQDKLSITKPKYMLVKNVPEPEVGGGKSVSKGGKGQVDRHAGKRMGKKKKSLSFPTAAIKYDNGKGRKVKHSEKGVNLIKGRGSSKLASPSTRSGWNGRK